MPEDDERLIAGLITLMELGFDAPVVSELIKRGMGALNAAVHTSAARRAEEEEQGRARDNARVNAACRQLDEEQHRQLPPDDAPLDFSVYEPPADPALLMDAQPLVRELFAQQISNLLDTPPRREFVLYCDVCGRKTSPRVHESCILCLRCLKLTLKNRRHGDPAFHAMMLERRRDKVLSKRIATTATHPWKGKRCP